VGGSVTIQLTYCISDRLSGKQHRMRCISQGSAATLFE